MGKGKSQTIGYHYLFSILFGIGRGPIDELHAIKVGEKLAWGGNAYDNTLQAINKPDLFGGEKKEGGIQGLFRLQQGQADQVLPGAQSGSVTTLGGFTWTATEGIWRLFFKAFNNGPNGGVRTLPDIKQQITSESGGNMGELRGRVTLWFDGLAASMNPYIKPWEFRVRRAKKGWHLDNCWYPAKAIIYLRNSTIHAMNPAHIIYECCTNPAWARGIDTSEIDENSFILAANQLCAEAFGLCLVWFRQEDISDFIQTVLDHIGAVLFTDRQTGKVTLKLVRDDYVVGDLPLFTPSSGLLEVLEDDTGSSDTAYNEVIVTGHDPIENNDIQSRAHNLAAFRAQGSPSTLDQPYPGLPTLDLCARVALRDLKVNAAGLRKFKVVLDRRGFRIHPGAVFRIAHPARGIGEIVLRAGEIDDGKMLDGKITISTVQDVFGLPSTSFVTPTENTWSPPSDIAEPVEDARLLEANFRQVYGTQGAAEAEAVPAGDSYAIVLASSPTPRTLSYDLLARAEGETDWRQTGEHYFTGTATLAAELLPAATTFVVENVYEFPPDSLVDQSLLVGDEYCRIDSYDSGTKEFTVARGVLDTWPDRHEAGTRIWLADDDPASGGRLYAQGETVEAKLLTRTFSSLLSEDEAPLLTEEMGGRVFRPYPPADVEVDGDSIYDPALEYTEPTITWAERNRITQADTMIGFFEGPVSAEPGTTYRIRVYNSKDAASPVATHDGIASGWQHTSTLQTADGVAPVGGKIWYELVAVRDGVESWEPTRFAVPVDSGYGYSYGYNYGGL